MKQSGLVEDAVADKPDSSTAQKDRRLHRAICLAGGSLTRRRSRTEWVQLASDVAVILLVEEKLPPAEAWPLLEAWSTEHGGPVELLLRGGFLRAVRAAGIKPEQAASALRAAGIEAAWLEPSAAAKPEPEAPRSPAQDPATAPTAPAAAPGAPGARPVMPSLRLVDLTIPPHWASPALRKQQAALGKVKAKVVKAMAAAEAAHQSAAEIRTAPTAAAADIRGMADASFDSRAAALQAADDYCRRALAFCQGRREAASAAYNADLRTAEKMQADMEAAVIATGCNLQWLRGCVSGAQVVIDAKAKAEATRQMLQPNTAEEQILGEALERIATARAKLTDQLPGVERF